MLYYNIQVFRKFECEKNTTFLRWKKGQVLLLFYSFKVLIFFSLFHHMLVKFGWQKFSDANLAFSLRDQFGRIVLLLNNGSEKQLKSYYQK